MCTHIFQEEEDFVTTGMYWQSIADNCRNALLVVDLNLVVRVFNSASTGFFNSFGIDMKIGGYFPGHLDSFPEDEKTQKVEFIRRALNGERFAALESWKGRFCQTEYGPLRHPNGQISGAVFVGRPLDAWSVAEEEPPQDNPDEFFWPHVVVFGRDTQAKSFSQQPSWENFTGQKFEQYNGLGWFEAFHPDCRERVFQIWNSEAILKKQNRKKPRTFSFMTQLWSAKQSMYRFILIHATPQFDGQGNEAYWTCSGIDIHEVRQLQIETERKRAEEAEENQRRQEEFIDTVCHEIRNPLLGIYGGVHLATEELNNLVKDLHQLSAEATLSVDRMKSYMKSLMKCAEQQKTILDDALDMSKIQHNKINLVSLPFQVSACIELVLDMFRPRAQEKNLMLTATIPSDKIFVVADMSRLQQVIINLVSNAIKFTHEGGVNVIAEVVKIDHQSILEVRVEDSGIGISEKEISILFDRFSQVNHAMRTYGGSGLGLAISKRLVETMGGSISVESVPGVGSCFKFHIKVSEATEQDIFSLLHNHPTDQGDLSVTKKRMNYSLNILVVDDNLLNQKILATYLEKSGHMVHVASDGVEAVQKSACQYYDVIFMDIEMPKMNGLEATATIRQRDKEFNIRSVIIGVSGNARKEKIGDALAVGMDFYLTKPYHKDEIMKVLEKYADSGNIRPRIKRESAEELQKVSKFQKLEFK